LILHLIYRISNNSYNKLREPYVTKESCLANALRTFPPSSTIQWIILGDTLNRETKKMILKKIDGLPFLRFFPMEIGSNAGSFNQALDLAMSLDSNDLVYMLEDDYLHVAGAYPLIGDGLEFLRADYVSLYDHPDKYIPSTEGGNPFIDQSGGEETKVFRGRYRHWKLTNSTTMTFAATVRTLKADEPTFRKWTSGTHPMDYQLFLELRDKGRLLMTSLPGASTHGDTAWIAPFTDWTKLA